MTIFLFSLRRSLRKKSTLGVMCALPLAMVVIRPLWTLEYGMGFLFYGLVIMFTAFSMVRSIMIDRVSGTVVRIFVAPVTTFQYLFYNLLAYLVIIGGQSILVVSVGYALYGWGIQMAVLLILTYIIFAIVSIAFSLAWDSMFHSRVMSDTVFSIVVSFMALLGGIFIPISMLPDFLQKVAMLFPTYWFSNSLLYIQDKEPHDQYWYSIIIMLFFSVVFVLYGSKRRLE